MNMSEIFGDEQIADVQTEQTEFAALPEGWYPVEVESMTDATSKAGNAMIKGRFVVVGDSFANRKLFVNFNVQHANPTVVAMAKRDLAALCKAVGLPQAQSTDELVGQTLEVKVVIRKDDATQNDVRGYRSVGSVAPAAAKPAVAKPAPKASAKPAAKPSAKLPWEK